MEQKVHEEEAKSIGRFWTENTSGKEQIKTSPWLNIQIVHDRRNTKVYIKKKLQWNEES